MQGEPSRAKLKYLIERQREEIRTVVEISQLLSVTTDSQEVIRRVATYLNRTFPLALCGVLLTEQRVLRLIQFAKVAQVDTASAIQQICTETGKDFPQPLREDDFERILEDQSSPPALWAQAAAVYLRSNYFAPMVFNGKPMGRLALFSTKADSFSKEDQHILDIVAEQLASVLHNALLMDELKRADQMKNDLLAIISHELRIPLTTLQEGSSLLLEGVLGPLSEKQTDFLKTIQRNGWRLQGLIEEVELAARLINGRISYTFDEVDLCAVVKDALEALRPMAQAKGVTLSATGADRTIPCQADAKRIGQALGQLLENSVQATPEGGGGTASPGADNAECRDPGGRHWGRDPARPDAQAVRTVLLRWGNQRPEDRRAGLGAVCGEEHYRWAPGHSEDGERGGKGNPRHPDPSQAEKRLRGGVCRHLELLGLLELFLERPHPKLQGSHLFLGCMKAFLKCGEFLR